jgi:hypothetical protein
MSLIIEKEPIKGLKTLAMVGEKKYLMLSDKPIHDGVPSFTCKGEDTIQQTYDKQTERMINYITAPSGAGKSYYTRELIKQYHKLYPKRDVFVFSSLSECATLDKLKYLKRIKIHEEEFLSHHFVIDDFKDTLCVFDDTDVIIQKGVKKKVYECLNLILQTGRHTNTSCIYTSHLATQGLDTKIILAEAHSVTVFPKNMGGKTSKYLLDQYLGFDKDEIKRLKGIKGRWATICKSYPMVVLTETEAFLLRQ